MGDNEPVAQSITENASHTLCMTIYSYKREGMSDEEYRTYMLEKHAPLASTLMEKYGITGFTMVHKITPNTVVLD